MKKKNIEDKTFGLMETMLEVIRILKRIYFFIFFIFFWEYIFDVNNNFNAMFFLAKKKSQFILNSVYTVQIIIAIIIKQWLLLKSKLKNQR